MANILFITYSDFTSNSAIQIHAFANQLSIIGHDCTVAVPENRGTVYEAIGGEVAYTPLDYRSLLDDGIFFNDGRGPDIIHAWTPREVVRKMCVRLVREYHCKLIVHLEDNEEQIIADYLHTTVQEIKSCPPEKVTAVTPESLSHIFFYRDFLDMADGITLIIDTLSGFVPAGKKHTVIWPGIDRSRFNLLHIDGSLKRALGIDEGTAVICYTGNVHSSNCSEVLSLYKAVAQLNLRGTPAVLVRTGRDCVPFPGDNLSWLRDYSIDLGFVPYGMISQILGIATLLVQPGKADNFNTFRLPAKLPEFFSMKKPVILPNANIGRFIRDGREGLLLTRGTATEIVEKMEIILGDTALAGALSEHAGNFADWAFNIEVNTQKLDSFYRTILEE